MGVKGRTVAFLVSDETDTSEFEPIIFELEKQGAESVIIGPDLESLERICLVGDCPVSCGLDVQAASIMEFDALVIPDGKGVDAFLHHDDAIDFVKRFEGSERPLVAIGRGVLMLAAADLLENRHVAAPDELWLDVQAAGGIMVAAPYMKELQDSHWITAKDKSQLGVAAESLTCVLADMPEIEVESRAKQRRP